MSAVVKPALHSRSYVPKWSYKTTIERCRDLVSWRKGAVCGLELLWCNAKRRHSCCEDLRLSGLRQRHAGLSQQICSSIGTNLAMRHQRRERSRARTLRRQEDFILLFSNIELAHAGAQSAAVKPENFSRTVFPAYLPSGLFKHPENVLPFDRLQGFLACR